MLFRSPRVPLAGLRDELGRGLDLVGRTPTLGQERSGARDVLVRDALRAQPPPGRGAPPPAGSGARGLARGPGPSRPSRAPAAGPGALPLAPAPGSGCARRASR